MANFTSEAEGQIKAAAGMSYHERASLALQQVTIVCPLSGRDWAWP